MLNSFRPQKKGLSPWAYLLLLLPWVSYASSFSLEKLSESLKQELRSLGIWKPGCPVPLDRLVLLHLSYYDFNALSHDDGQMIVMDAIGPKTLEAFRALYLQRFPFTEIRLINAYGGDDEKSMEANNTSAFNCRALTGGSSFSIHAYGLAIDVNPLQNPYLNSKKNPVQVLPPKGLAFLDRTRVEPGMVEDVTSVFASNGLSIWGGAWRNPKDWQHFQVASIAAQLMALMTAQDAESFFESYSSFPTMFNRVSVKTDGPRFIRLYRKNPARFLQLLQQNEKMLSTLAPSSAAQYLEDRF
jgi:hypothetical protein